MTKSAMMTPMSFDAELVRRLQLAKRLARQAGGVLLDHYGHIERYDEKGRADLVTVADRASEALISEGITQAFPSDRQLREESDGVEAIDRLADELRAAEFTWCVDPLDGTTSFVHTYPVFAVSIGLLSRGKPVLGVVFAPKRSELFVGGVGIPARLNGQPISASKTPSLSRSLIATGFHPELRNNLEAMLAPIGRVLTHSHGIRRAGAAALDLCDVACGRVDAFFELGLSPWDVAAGHAIVEAAGGMISGFSSVEHDVFRRETLASNGLVHEELRELM